MLSLSSPNRQKCDWNDTSLGQQPLIYFTLNEIGTIAAVNPEGATVLGYTPDALIGQCVLDLIGDGQARLRSLITSRSTEQLNDETMHLICHDGRSLKVGFSLQVLQESNNQLSSLLVCNPTPQTPSLLQQREWSHRAATTGFPVGIFFADAMGRYIEVSGRYCEITGISHTAAQGDGWVKALDVHDSERVIAEWQQAVKTETPFRSEYRLQPVQGMSIWVLAQAMAERNEVGVVTGYVGTITDISDRKQAEAALRQQAKRERLLRSISQHVHQSLDLKHILHTTVTEVRQILQADRVLIYRVHTNDSSSVMMEATAPGWSSLRAQPLSNDLLPRDDQQFYHHGRAYIINDVDHEFSLPDLADFLRQQEVKSTIIVPISQTGNLWGVLIAHQCRSPHQWQPWEIDLLEQLASQVEFAIQQSELYQQVQRLNADLERQIQSRTAQLQLAFEFEATLKRITDKVRDSLDEDQILQAAVQELAQVIGVSGCNAALYDLEQGTSTIRYEFTTTVSPSQGRVAQISAYSEIYEQLFRGESFQFCSLVPSPVRGHVAMLSSPIFDDQGMIGDLWLINHKYYAFSEQDIRLVEQVANQCAIAIRQARLYQAAQAQVQELEKLNRLKDDFLSTVSHELRTPMSSIKMAAQMLESILFKTGKGQTISNHDLIANERKAPTSVNLNSSDCEKASRYFQILRTECHREISLINDLLDLSRLTAGTQPLVLTSIDVRHWMVPLIEPFIERSQRHQQTLQVQIPPAMPFLTTDCSELERIFTELLNNACKYTPAGGHVTVTAKVEGDRFQLRVQNSGVEIPLIEQARIFDKFYRIPNNDPWQYGGTGLGLALVKKLIEHLNGTITVESAAQQTSFIVELPLHLQVKS